MDFVDLKSQYRALETGLVARLRSVMERSSFILGQEVRELEEALAKIAGTAHCVSCANGTDALQLCLMSLGIGPGDGVLVPTFTFVASAEVISLLGARPIFVDVDPLTFNIDPADLERRLSSCPPGTTPRAVIAVDLFGHPADYDSLRAIADPSNLIVIEDAAQSLGASLKGKAAGSLGRLGSTSFFPSKPLGCYGDGGAIFCESEDEVEMLRSIRMHGQGAHKYENVRVGVNSRLDTLQAAILLEKLKLFESERECRRALAEIYSNELRSHVKTPRTRPGVEHAWAQYSVVTENGRRDEIASSMKADGIPTMIYYPLPLHRQRAFASLGYREGDFPVAEDLSRRILSIPIHPYLAESDQSRVIEAVKKGCGHR